jgi:hypothetical protein
MIVLAIDPATRAGWCGGAVGARPALGMVNFGGRVRDGGRAHLSCVEGELIKAFAGAATALQYLNVQIALGEISEVSLTGYAHMASTMLRIAAKLGLSKRVIDVTPPLSEYLQSLKDDEPLQSPDPADDNDDMALS